MELLSYQSKLVICMIGLPARGKTYISRKASRYLNWIGNKCRVYNIENYRRSIVGTHLHTDIPITFFDPTNEDAANKRSECAKQCLQDLIKFLNEEGGEAALYDGTNTTRQRRLFVKETLEKAIKNVKIIWVESILKEESLIEKNIRAVKINYPDYSNVDPYEATLHYKKKIESINQFYETLTPNEYSDISYLQIIDAGKDVLLHNIKGYLPTKLISYILNLQNHPKCIYFTRHGESVFNTEDRVGGDSDLSENGLKYCKFLNEFFHNESKTEGFDQYEEDPKIFTSTLVRAKHTAGEIKLPKVHPISLKILDEINAGNLDSMTYAEIKNAYPNEYQERDSDKLRYRYPRGESYLDLIQRIEPIIFEIERSRGPVIIVSHQATLRCIYAYFSKQEILEVPHVCMPLNTVIKLIPETYFCKEKRFEINIATGEVKENEITQLIETKDYRYI